MTTSRRDFYTGLFLLVSVVLLVAATFFAASGERVKRITAAFDWAGVVQAKNFRVDAWVTPPAYTGKPPLILPGIRARLLVPAVMPSAESPRPCLLPGDGAAGPYGSAGSGVELVPPWLPAKE